MRGARNWLADDRRAQRIFGFIGGVAAAGGLVGVMFHRQQHAIADAAFLLTASLIVIVSAIRALAVNSPWLGGLGVGLPIVAVILHWHPVWTFDLLVSLGAVVVLYVLTFHVHPPGREDRDDGATLLVGAIVLGNDATAIDPDSAIADRPLPGDPDFTYPSPPR